MAAVALPDRLRLTAAERRRLARVAGGEGAADLALDDARVLNVFTGRIDTATVAIAHGRVARVGAPCDATTREDMGGALVIPGLIDAHTHVDMLCLAEAFL